MQTGRSADTAAQLTDPGQGQNDFYIDKYNKIILDHA